MSQLHFHHTENHLDTCYSLLNCSRALQPLQKSPLQQIFDPISFTSLAQLFLGTFSLEQALLVVSELARYHIQPQKHPVAYTCPQNALKR